MSTGHTIPSAEWVLSVDGAEVWRGRPVGRLVGVMHTEPRIVRLRDQLVDDYCLWLTGSPHGVKVRHDGDGVDLGPRANQEALSAERGFAIIAARLAGAGEGQDGDVAPHWLYMSVYAEAARQGLPVPVFVTRSWRLQRVTLSGVIR
jgi:hypothetical protein